MKITCCYHINLRSSDNTHGFGMWLKYLIHYVIYFWWSNTASSILGITKSGNGPLTRYVKLRVVHASGMPGIFPRHRLQRKPLVSDPGKHHGTCVTHVPWCISGSLTRGGGENVPGISGACATRSFTYLTRGPWLRVWRRQAIARANTKS